MSEFEERCVVALEDLLDPKTHEALRQTGMFWEFFPELTGLYSEDVKTIKEWLRQKEVTDNG